MEFNVGFDSVTLSLLKVIFGADFPARPKEELADLTDVDGSLLSLVSLVLIGLQKMLETAFVFDTLPLKVSCMHMMGYQFIITCMYIIVLNTCIDNLYSFLKIFRTTRKQQVWLGRLAITTLRREFQPLRMERCLMTS